MNYTYFTSNGAVEKLKGLHKIIKIDPTIPFSLVCPPTAQGWKLFSYYCPLKALGQTDLGILHDEDLWALSLVDQDGGGGAVLGKDGPVQRSVPLLTITIK